MNKPYTLVEHENSNFYGVKFLEGKYKDVVVVYGTVSLRESEDKEYAKLSFTFNVQDPAEHDADTLSNSEEFKNYLGDMLQDIMVESLTEKGAQIGSKGKD